MYCLKRTDGQWEEVDEFIFQNADHVVLDSDKKRYTPTRVFIASSGAISVHGLVESVDLLAIARAAGERINIAQAITIQKPEFVTVKKRSTVLYNVQTGAKYKKV